MASNKQNSHSHHYVPQWYQRQFLLPGSTQLHRLDLKPDCITLPSGRLKFRDAYLRRPPSCLFAVDDLYMLRFGALETDIFEKEFFGEVDRQGAVAVPMFAQHESMTSGIAKVHKNLLRYMGAQRFRTPRGLDWLKADSNRTHEQVLLRLRRLFEAHGTMWAEGVWELVRADHSPTKFIISDSPVSFYNKSMPPSLARYPGTEELDRIGTRSIFPLGPDRCLIISHKQHVNDPNGKPTLVRTNARSFAVALNYLADIQIGRHLTEHEVKKINFIMKKSATRYIAAGKKEWLYPEEGDRTFGWAALDDDWFLMPNPWRTSVGQRVTWGTRDGRSYSLDEYGRNHVDPRYRDQEQFAREYAKHERTKGDWAIKRRGSSRGRTLGVRDEVRDRLIDQFLEDYDAAHAAKRKK